MDRQAPARRRAGSRAIRSSGSYLAARLIASMTHPMNSVSARLLMIWLLCILEGTLAPFDFVSAAGLKHGLQLFASSERDPGHFVFNMLMFVPFGMLLH